MQIVHVVRQYYPSIGGMENVVKALATSQVLQGHDVRVVTLNRIFNSDMRNLPEREWRSGVEIVRIPFFGSKRYPIALGALRHIRGADIVHVHGVDFFFDFFAWTQRLHHRKLILSTHGGFFHTGFAARFKQFYFKTMTRLSLRKYAGVAAVSTSDRDTFAAIRKGDVELIENGVDIQKYGDASAPAPTKNLITIGRLSGNKRIDHAIRFLAALHGVDKAWTLTIAGRPWDVTPDSLTKLARELGVADKVRIMESPPDWAVRDAIRNCSAFVSASDYEGFGLAIIEAMSAGLWPVMSGIPPYLQLAQKTKLGTVTDFNDPDTAARQFLADWTAITSNHRHYRQAAIDAASAFGWPQVNEAYERFYATIRQPSPRNILNVPILAKTSDEAIDLLDEDYKTPSPSLVVFANAHTLNATVASDQVRTILNNSIVFNDGIGVDLASRMLFGEPFPENLNGTDFIPRYLQTTKHRYRIFLVGGEDGIARRAAKRLSHMAPQHKFVGANHGYATGDDLSGLLRQIRRSRADVLLVAMGNPLQEIWLNEHLKSTGCRLGFGVGGLFDFMAEAVPRAPQWVQNARLEWSFRLLQEPKRLWQRYLVQMPIFMMRVSQQRTGTGFRNAVSR